MSETQVDIETLETLLNNANGELHGLDERAEGYAELSNAVENVENAISDGRSVVVPTEPLTRICEFLDAAVENYENQAEVERALEKVKSRL